MQMNELLPCPFCGGEASTYSMETWWVSHACDCLGKYVGTKEYATEAEAIAAWNSRADYHGYEQAAIEAWESIKAWNSRAERTTDDEWEIYHHSVPATDENMAKFGWVRERTCEFNIKDNMNETEGMGDVWIECSACNCVFDFYADEWLMKMSYCPNCGARRVGE